MSMATGLLDLRARDLPLVSRMLVSIIGVPDVFVIVPEFLVRCLRVLNLIILGYTIA